jgi:hypothetical protein
MNTETQNSNPNGRQFPGLAPTMSATFKAAGRSDDVFTPVADLRDRSKAVVFSRLPPLDWPANLFD